MERSIPISIEAALEHHEAGRLPEAEAIYRQVLAKNPANFDALHLLGVIANQSGKSELAAGLIGQALQQNPQHPFALNNLGLALQASGRLDEAATTYRKAISAMPDFADAHYNLGNVLLTQNKPDEAVASYQRALALQPDDAEAHNNLGSALRNLVRTDEAVACYRKALSFRPDYAEALNNLGATLHEQGKLDEAIVCFNKAISIQPNHVEAHKNLGIALQAQSRFDEALASCRKVLLLKPDMAEAYIIMGNALREQNKPDDAAESYRKALALKPDYAEAHYNLGTLFKEQGQLNDAAKHFYNTLSLKPDYAEAHNNLGGVLRSQGNLDEAIECFRKALSLKPDFDVAHSNLLFAMTYHPECSPMEYLAEARRYGSMVGARAKPYTQWHTPPVDDTRPLRVGLISGDLLTHPVGFFLESILAHLNPARVELMAYVTNPREDALTARIKSRFTVWDSIAELSDEAAAQKIHSAGTHILIDLAGHTGYNRLPVFAWKPAPVQLSWLGYWASTGTPGIDYLLADSASVPESHQAHFTETIWYLPDTRLCFTPPEDNPRLTPSPLPVIRNGYITFGSFQNLGKINDKVLALWSRLLHALPDARLKLQNNQMNCPEASKQLQLRLTRFGIAPERITVEKHLPREDYLAAYTDVDIVLDTFPFPGGTTTCDALWMGVPTLTLAGNTLVGRQGVSMLTCSGLEDWIASDEDDFVVRAVAHATDTNWLAQLRANLQQKVLDSPLFDGARFALHLENALHAIWQQRMGTKHTHE